MFSLILYVPHKSRCMHLFTRKSSRQRLSCVFTSELADLFHVIIGRSTWGTSKSRINEVFMENVYLIQNSISYSIILFISNILKYKVNKSILQFVIENLSTLGCHDVRIGAKLQPRHPNSILGDAWLASQSAHVYTMNIPYLADKVRNKRAERVLSLSSTRDPPQTLRTFHVRLIVVGWARPSVPGECMSSETRTRSPEISALWASERACAWIRYPDPNL